MKHTTARRRQPLLQALEPRMMFDGAVAATAAGAVADAAHDAAHPASVAEKAVEAPTPAPAAPTTSTAAQGKQVVFIENDVTNYQSLIAQLPAGDQVVVLDSKSDGLAQIAQWASTHKGFSAIHIISHGEANDLMLGTLSLGQANLASRQADLSTIGQSLQPGGDILLYGCDIAAGTQGEAFIQSLAQDTHADVAASIDATGSASRGGNWTLERSTGAIESASLDLQYDGLLAQPVSGLSTFDTVGGPTIVSGSSAGMGLSATNVNGWDVTLRSASATNCYIGAEALTGQTILIDGNSLDGTPLSYMQFKADNGSLFTLNAVDLAMAGSSVSSTGVLQLVGYLNGSAVSGAIMSLMVTDADVGGQLVTFNVSNNSAFQGIDSFRVQTDGSYQVTGGFGVDNVNATNFHFPGPVVTTSGGNSAYSGGTGNAVTVDSSLTLSDSSSGTQSSATVSITGNFHSGEDVLTFSNTSASTFGNISASYNSGTGVLTLTSSGATATTAQWQSALAAVTYQDTSLTPNTSPRTVSFSINDGSNTSTTVTKGVTVTADVAPVLSNLNGDGATYTAGGSAVHLDSGSAATVTDSDSPNFSSGNVTAHISANGHSSEDVLGIDTSGTVSLSAGTTVGSTVSVGGVAIGTIASNGDGVGGHDLIVTLNSNATASRVTTLVDALSYNNSAGSPNTATRTIQVAVNDGHGQTSATASVLLTVINAPILTASGGSVAFVAGDNTASTPVAVDNGLTVTDPGSSTLASATVSISGNFHSGEDVLAFSNDGSSMGNIVATYNSGTGVLTLTSSGASATLAQWQAALRAVTYTDSAVTPNTATRTFSFQASDGSGNTSGTVTRSVTVTATDQTPIATASGGSTTFTAGDNTSSTPVAVDSGLTLSDLDDSTLASATAAISGNFHSGEDVLAFSNTSAVTFGNISASYNSGSGVLTLTSSGATATLVQWQNALRAVTYTDSAVTPNTATRTISFRISDGSKTSAAVTKSVTVAATEQSPVLTTSGGSAAFTAGNNTSATPVVVDSGISVSDLDSSTLDSAMVSITGNFHSSEDILAFSNTNATSFGNIAASYNSATGVLTLTSSGATATLAQWQAALRAVTYTDSAVTPNTATRTIGFIISDGTQSSSVGNRSVTVTAVDQTPLASTSGGSATFNISGSPVPVIVDGGISVSDLDNSTLASATVAISGNFHSGEDVLGFSNTNTTTFGNIAASYNSGTGVLTLTSSGATATLAQWQGALRAVTYLDSAGSPDTSTRTISFVVNDGSQNSSAVTRAVALQLPTPSTDGLSAATDTGASSSDGITDNATPTVTGTALANASVTVFVDGVAVGSTSTDGSGVWQYTLPSALTDGSHTLSAQISSGGNHSGQSSAYSVTIDTVAPQVQSITPQGTVPAGASSVSYDVLFSEPVNGLSVGAFSVVSSGSATGTVSSVVALSSTHYVVQLSGVGGTGSLAVALGSGAAADVAGNGTASSFVSSAARITAVVVPSTPPASTPATTQDTTPTPPSPPTPPASTSVSNAPSTPIVLVPITPNIVLAALNPAQSAPAPLTAAAATGSVAAGAMPTAVSTAPAFGQDHFSANGTDRSPFPATAATRSDAQSFVSTQLASQGPALQVIPDLGARPLVPGQSFSFTLPPGTVMTRDANATLSIRVTQSNGQPLPGWLRFDPQTGRFSGTPPTGWSRQLSLDVTVQDRNGHRGVTHLQLQTGAQPRADAGARTQVAGKQALNEQFRQHGREGLAARLANWLAR